MIEIVDGVGVGSGKSFYVMTRCLDHFLRGGTVYSSDSFVLLFDKIKEYAEKKYGLVLEDRQYQQVPADEMLRLHESTPPGTDDCPVLIVVDEAQDFFDVRDHADKNKRAFFSWCTQSRHDNNDLIFITQDANNIDARFRRLATFRITVRNTLNWKVPGFGSIASIIQLGTLFTNNGHYFVVHVYDRDGRTLFERKWIKALQELFNLYVSKSMQLKHKRSGAAVGKVELKRVERKSSMVKYLVFGFLVVALTAGVIFGKRFFSGDFFGGDVTAQESSSVNHGTVKRTPRKEDAVVSSYEIIKEAFRGFVELEGYVSLRSDSGQYLKGAMSPHGYVVGVDVVGRVAKCVGGDGRDVFVVLVDLPEKRDQVSDETATSKLPTAAPMPEPERQKSAGPRYMGYGESIATGHGRPENLDYAQQIVTGVEDRGPVGAVESGKIAAPAGELKRGPL